jgi:3-oxoacyl-[acyl-carrier protein] reductase
LFATLEETSSEQCEDVFAVNVRGTFMVTQALMPVMNDGGRVINLSSGLSKRPENQMVAYSMTKGAIDSFTIALAKEYGSRQITVNAVAPGWTHTEANDTVLQDESLRGFVVNGTPLGRLGTPQDIANVVSWLSTDEASWVTGQWLEASGGFGL